LRTQRVALVSGATAASAWTSWVDLADLAAVRQLDIADAASVAGPMSRLDRRPGKHDVFVNNASVLLAIPGGALAYRVSKSAVNALTRVLANELAPDGILINACRPFVNVDPPNCHGPATRPMSAEAPVWLATLPDDGPTGGFWRSRGPIDR
jgi:NAD(P)-dependent dehydrogenase (short-subunit alcohol dehydrogenase family)